MTTNLQLLKPPQRVPDFLNLHYCGVITIFILSCLLVGRYYLIYTVTSGRHDKHHDRLYKEKSKKEIEAPKRGSTSSHTQFNTVHKTPKKAPTDENTSFVIEETRPPISIIHSMLWALGQETSFKAHQLSQTRLFDYILSKNNNERVLILPNTLQLVIKVLKKQERDKDTKLKNNTISRYKEAYQRNSEHIEDYFTLIQYMIMMYKGTVKMIASSVASQSMQSSTVQSESESKIEHEQKSSGSLMEKDDVYIVDQVVLIRDLYFGTSSTEWIGITNRLALDILDFLPCVHIKFKRLFSISKFFPDKGLSSHSELITLRDELRELLREISTHLEEIDFSLLEAVSIDLNPGYVSNKDLKVIREIAKGGIGEVSMVRYNGNGKIYAMKRIPKSLIGRKIRADNILNEANIHARLFHKSIPRLLTSFDDDTHIVFIMEYLYGIELFDLIGSSGDGLPLDQVKLISYQLIKVIMYLHSKGIMHRDIKPENIIVYLGCRISLLDFGFSKYVGDGRTKTKCGTDYYYSPEMLLEVEYSYPSDVYVIGLLIFSLMYHAYLFVVESKDEVFDIKESLKLRQKANFVFPEKGNKEDYGPLKDLIQRLCHPVPEKRLQLQYALEHSAFESINRGVLTYTSPTVQIEIEPKGSSDQNSEFVDF